MTQQILVMPTNTMEFSFYPNKVTGLALRLQTFPSLLGGHIAACLITTHGGVQIGHLSVANYGNQFQPLIIFRQARYINLTIAPMTTLMTLEPPLEMPLLKLPRQQLGAPKQRNRSFVRS